MMQLPAPLVRAFEQKVTITAGELCRLLPIDRKTLHRHIRAGHISWVQLGMGDRAVRRGFTLKAVMQFLEDRERVVSPSEPGRPRRSRATRALGVDEHDILVLQDSLLTERAIRQRKGRQLDASERAFEAFRSRLAAARAQRVADREAKLQR